MGVFRLCLPFIRPENHLGGHPNVFMMEPADALELNHPPLFWRLNWSSGWSVLF